MDGVRTCDSPPPIRIPLKWAGVVTAACKPRARSGCALGEGVEPCLQALPGVRYSCAARADCLAHPLLF